MKGHTRGQGEVIVIRSLVEEVDTSKKKEHTGYYEEDVRPCQFVVHFE